MKNRTRTASIALAAAFSASALVQAGGQAAEAAPAASAATEQGPIVLLGDSVLANPAYAQILTKGFGPVPGLAASPGTESVQAPMNSEYLPNCAHSENTVGATLQSRGHEVYDFTCAGAGILKKQDRIEDLNEQVDELVAQGRVSDNSRVFINIGFNDVASPGNLPASKDADYVAQVSEQIDKIRSIAPGAKISMVTYPVIAEGPLGLVCPLRVAPDSKMPMTIPAFPVKLAEDRLEARARQVAEAKGLGVVDARAASAGKNSCGSDADRWVAAGIDVPAENEIYFHLTDVGINGVADLIEQA